MVKASDLKIGDNIIFDEDGSVAEVLEIDRDELGITVYFPKTGEETWIECWQFSYQNKLN